VAVIVVCVLAVLAGLVATVRWGGLTVQPPHVPLPEGAGADDPPAAGLVVRRFVWSVNLALVAGIGAGIMAAGAGGRLVMRLLAVTAGDDAQGRITEANEVVGRISADGTFGFVVFTALFLGSATGGGYLLLRRWLPAGRAGGLAYGGLLLVLAGTRLEPLREGNPDFDLVGPGWVSVTAFAALVLFQGMLVAALAGRISRVVPLLGSHPRAVALHAPLLLLAPVPVVALVLVIAAALLVLVTRARPVIAAWHARRFRPAGQAVLVLVALVALPGFVSSVARILVRG
jgi:hypothetical protein